jgi:hypothetical protein
MLARLDSGLHGFLWSAAFVAVVPARVLLSFGRCFAANLSTDLAATSPYLAQILSHLIGYCAARE